MERFPCNVSAIWLGRPALGFLLSFTTSSCTVKWKSVFFMVQFPPHFFAFHCYPYLQNNSVMRLYAKEQSMHLLTEQVEREQLWTQTAAWELQRSCVCQHERLETKKKNPNLFYSLTSAEKHFVIRFMIVGIFGTFRLAWALRWWCK